MLPDSKKRLGAYDLQRATFKPRRNFANASINSMPSSKGEPTDPELREKIKEEVKNEEKGMFSV